MLPKEAIQEYKKIYLNVIGEAIDDKEAETLANDLINFYKAVYLPVPAKQELTKTQYEKINTDK